MSLTEDLYRDIILEHYKNPRNHGRLESPTVTSDGANPFCGDELTLTLQIENDTLTDIKMECQGCSISQSSVSMMTDAVKGKTLSDVETFVNTFKTSMLENKPMAFGEDDEDLEALEGVKKYPVRIKCALLGWNTLLEGLQAYKDGQTQVSHVEGEEKEEPKPDLNFLVGNAQQDKTPDLPTDATEILQNQVRETLKKVIDPELNINVVDLGLIYEIHIKEDDVKVDFTLTSPGCPLAPMIQGQIQSVLNKINWVNEVSTELVWSPPWDPKTMASEEAKDALGIW